MQIYHCSPSLDSDCTIIWAEGSPADFVWASLQIFGRHGTQEDEKCSMRIQGKNVDFLCYVDDLLVMGPSKGWISDIAKELRQCLQTKYLGPVNKILGIKMPRAEGTFSPKQSIKVEFLLSEMSMDNFSASSFPMDNFINNSVVQVESHDATFSYSKVIGKVLYMSTHTRPDLSLAVSVLAPTLWRSPLFIPSTTPSSSLPPITIWPTAMRLQFKLRYVSYLESFMDHHTVTIIIWSQIHHHTAKSYHIVTCPPSYRYEISYRHSRRDIMPHIVTLVTVSIL